MDALQSFKKTIVTNVAYTFQTRMKKSRHDTRRCNSNLKGWLKNLNSEPLIKTPLH